MDERQQKGLMIAATSKITRKGDAAWSVPSQSLNGRYTVEMGADGAHCSCPDHELRQKPCKHIFAVEFVIQRETVTAPDGTVTETETRGVRVTYAQNWPAYNQAQTTEKDHFLRLLRELVAMVPSPCQATGRPRVPLSDQIFAACFKVYSGFSARRFSTDLREAEGKGLIDKAPHFNSVLRCLESEEVTPVLHGLIKMSSLPLRHVETKFAVDSTGFGTSNYFRYYSVKYGHEQYGREWVKTHAMVGVKTNIVTAVSISGMNEHDSPQFAGLVEKTAERFTMEEVSADKAYSGRANLDLVASHGAEPYNIPFRSNSRPDPKSPVWNKLYHLFAFKRDEFLPHYHLRSNVESTFSAIKRKFGDSVRSKTRIAQINEVLMKVLAHNIVCLIHEMHELGVTPSFEPTLVQL
jgi:transposase